MLKRQESRKLRRIVIAPNEPVVSRFEDPHRSCKRVDSLRFPVTDITSMVGGPGHPERAGVRTVPMTAFQAPANGGMRSTYEHYQQNCAAKNRQQVKIGRGATAILSPASMPELPRHCGPNVGGTR